MVPYFKVLKNILYLHLRTDSLQIHSNAHWSKVMVGGTIKIRHCFVELLVLKARNLKFLRFLLLKIFLRVLGSWKTKDLYSHISIISTVLLRVLSLIDLHYKIASREKDIYIKLENNCSDSSRKLNLNPIIIKTTMPRGNSNEKFRNEAENEENPICKWGISNSDSSVILRISP